MRLGDSQLSSSCLECQIVLIVTCCGLGHLWLVLVLGSGCACACAQVCVGVNLERKKMLQATQLRQQTHKILEKPGGSCIFVFFVSSSLLFFLFPGWEYLGVSDLISVVEPRGLSLFFAVSATAGTVLGLWRRAWTTSMMVSMDIYTHTVG